MMQILHSVVQYQPGITSKSVKKAHKCFNRIVALSHLSYKQ